VSSELSVGEVVAALLEQGKVGVRKELVAEALSAAEEAASIYRRLIQEIPEAFIVQRAALKPTVDLLDQLGRELRRQL
jgi:hypothetical protein